MRNYLLATVATLLLAAGTPGANATTIAVFGQEGTAPTVNAIDNGTTTTITVTDALTDLTALFGFGPVTGALFDLTATSIDAAVQVGSAVIQHYSGSFCITSGAGCSGTDYLSGTFTDAAFGALGGPGLVVNVNNPPDALSLFSDVVPTADLNPPSTFDLSFAEVNPVLHIDGTTIGAFTASFAGDVSAETVNATEPGTLAILGMGLLGLGMVTNRRKVFNDAT